MTKEEIRTWIDENDRCDWGASMSVNNMGEVLALALEAIELRALVPSEEEISNLVRACDGRGFDNRVTDDWLDRVRAWKGQSR
jgi:hypothetical protein